MIPITLTERTITSSWDKEAQEHVKRVTHAQVLVNPDQIVFVKPSTDAPEKYSSHLRMANVWDLFVVEPADRIEQRIEVARKIQNTELATALWQVRAI